MGPIIGHSDGRYGGTTHGMRAQSTAALVAMANLKGRHPAAGPQHQPTELPELTGAAPASPPALRCPPAGNVTFAVVDMQTNEKFETVSSELPRIWRHAQRDHWFQGLQHAMPACLRQTSPRETRAALLCRLGRAGRG